MVLSLVLASYTTTVKEEDEEEEEPPPKGETGYSGKYLQSNCAYYVRRWIDQELKKELGH